MSVEFIAHLVPQGSVSLTARCGKRLGLGDGHTGYYPGGVTFARDHGDPYCPKCLEFDLFRARTLAQLADDTGSLAAGAHLAGGAVADLPFERFDPQADPAQASLFEVTP